MKYQISATGEHTGEHFDREEMHSMEAPSTKRKRIEAIDFARGVAVTLMILSHGVKGLLSFEQIPSWGLVPIHLLTKFSSSLFIIVFGVSIAVSCYPSIGTPRWAEQRKKLLIRGIRVFVWYKVLTIVEMAHLYSRHDILNTLLYKAFPVYVEILGFYAIALLWVPLVLPIWKKSYRWLQVTLPVGLAVLSTYLFHHFDFWNIEALKAILVEHEKHYTWGQLARAPLILVGLLFGEMVLRWYWNNRKRFIFATGLFGASMALFGAFFILASSGNIREELVSVAMNEGKHPPELLFMLFSIGGALLILSFTLAGGELLARILRPITTIGKDALQSFIFHIFVIFVFYRYLFDYWQKITYAHALGLTALLIVLTAVWVRATQWVQQSRS